MEKLVRDRIKEFSRAAKDGRVFRKAKKREMPVLLAHKLIEEAHEVAEELYASKPSTRRIVEELADLSEVMRAVMDHYRIDPKTIWVAKFRKAYKKGVFRNRVVLNLETNPVRFKKRTRHL